METDEYIKVIKTKGDDYGRDNENPKSYLTWYQKFSPYLKMRITKEYSNSRDITKLLLYKYWNTKGYYE